MPSSRRTSTVAGPRSVLRTAALAAAVALALPGVVGAASTVAAGHPHSAAVSVQADPTIAPAGVGCGACGAGF